MRFGTFFLLQSPDLRSSHMVDREAMAQMVLAEELGFDSVWFAEHHFSSYGYIPSLHMFAAALARETTRVRLGTAVVVLPFSHPLRVAEEVAMVDLLSDGRLKLGLGRGYQPYEFERFGLTLPITVRCSTKRWRSCSRPGARMCSVSRASSSRFRRHRFSPNPCSNPIPRSGWPVRALKQWRPRRDYKCITGGAARTRAVVKQNRAIFDEGMQRAGCDPAAADFGVQHQVLVAESNEEARQYVEQSLWHYRMATRLRMGKARVERGRAIAEPVDGEPSPDQMFDDALIYGDPATCVNKIRWYCDEVGVTSMNCSFNIGNLTAEQITHSMRLFATEVMPHFH
jgi:alkanesulfonate monooxygenase SsuD/methylene tetrahydromethanopterin reductase-like flavin-dependent oxidoreductase (luciferase family)